MKKKIDGKVRDVYEVDDKQLVIVTTDRISSFDVIIPKTVKNKGKLLNEISMFWFEYTKDIVENHIISDKISDMPKEFQSKEYEGRTILVKKLNIIPYEFIVRGYIFGNMWSAYKEKTQFCGIDIKGQYEEAQKLENPILTPSTKANSGHDIYVSFDSVINDIGSEKAKLIKDICFNLYSRCFEYAYENGIIIADTKFEFGTDDDGNIVLADEILTPDSSRFWSLEDYKVGESPKSYDKQFVRDWLINNKVDNKMQFNNIPDEIIEKTAAIYQKCRDRIVRM